MALRVLPPQSPNHNAICDRFIGSLRRECLDHILNQRSCLHILSERQLRTVIKDYVWYFNHARPHQGLRQRIPDLVIGPELLALATMKIVVQPMLGGLHHHYLHAA